MGSQIATELAGAEITLRQQLVIHLTANHYPPIPTTMVEPCVESIELARLGYWDTEINLPDGVMYHGKHTAPVSVIIEHHHLNEWLATDTDNGKEVE